MESQWRRTSENTRMCLSVFVLGCSGGSGHGSNLIFEAKPRSAWLRHQNRQRVKTFLRVPSPLHLSLGLGPPLGWVRREVCRSHHSFHMLLAGDLWNTPEARSSIVHQNNEWRTGTKFTTAKANQSWRSKPRGGFVSWNTTRSYSIDCISPSFFQLKEWSVTVSELDLYCMLFRHVYCAKLLFRKLCSTDWELSYFLVIPYTKTCFARF